MTFFSGFAVYFIIWWLTLFLVLPHGVRSQAEAGRIEPGTDPGAPERTHLGLKLAANTVLAGIVFGVWYLLTEVFGYSLATLAVWIGPE